MAKDLEIKDELDPRKRDLKGLLFSALGIIAFLYGVFHFFRSPVGPFMKITNVTDNASLRWKLFFRCYKRRINRQSVGPYCWDYFCIVLASLSCIYLIVNYDFVMNSSANSTPTQVTLGWVTIVLLLEAARRVMGMVFPLLAVIAILYGLFGNYFPGIWYHRGI